MYHLGIVDFLQNWTVPKKFERLFKTYVQRKDPDGLSVMHPLQYKLRFQAKMDQIFDRDYNSANVVQTRKSASAAFQHGEITKQTFNPEDSPGAADNVV